MLEDTDDDACEGEGLNDAELALDVADIVVEPKELSVLPTGIVEQASVTLSSLIIVTWHLDPMPEETAV